MYILGLSYIIYTLQHLLDGAGAECTIRGGAVARLSGAGAVGVRARRHGGVSVRRRVVVALLRSCAVASRCRVVAVLHRRVVLLRSCAVASRHCSLAPSRRAVAVLHRRVAPLRSCAIASRRYGSCAAAWSRRVVTLGTLLRQSSEFQLLVTVTGHTTTHWALIERRGLSKTFVPQH